MRTLLLTVIAAFGAAAIDGPEVLNQQEEAHLRDLRTQELCNYASIADHLEALFGAADHSDVLRALQECRQVMSINRYEEAIETAASLKERLARKRADDQLLRDVALGKDVQAMLTDLEIAAKGIALTPTHFAH
eukprot:Blabericola_migrator_1__3575@NODE_2062_length_3345_cov_8_187919_g1307_i0_p4_GENE_NODE_2062_length_3345_cov_8_187919_g1307_i0NODE_2062_length_3345_cov_8_187919_g1307_i0_p4_ORF_typecomplete_len134_score32_21AlkA_N/PF06029_11/0_04_NODE_2062_length_3345_cov_8_187919_g1307_i029023303